LFTDTHGTPSSAHHPQIRHPSTLISYHQWNADFLEKCDKLGSHLSSFFLSLAILLILQVIRPAATMNPITQSRLGLTFCTRAKRGVTPNRQQSTPHMPHSSSMNISSNSIHIIAAIATPNSSRPLLTSRVDPRTIKYGHTHWRETAASCPDSRSSLTYLNELGYDRRQQLYLNHLWQIMFMVTSPSPYTLLGYALYRYGQGVQNYQYLNRKGIGYFKRLQKI
jgi:hypothetical protein